MMLRFHEKSFSFHYFLELKFICQLGQTQIHIVLSFIFMIGQHKLILIIRINEIDALVSKEKLLFPSFFRVKFQLLVGTNTDSLSNLFFSWLGTINSFSLSRHTTLMLWFHKKSYSFYHFLELKFICQLGQTRIHIVISFLFLIRHHRLILIVGIHGIDALVS